MADLTTQILVEIRDEIRSTKQELGARIDQTNTQLDRMNTRLDRLEPRFDRLERRQVEGELRLGTEIATLTGVMRDLRDRLIEDHSLRDVVDHERRLVTLETTR